MSSVQGDRPFFSRELQDAAGLSARQQNDWDGRGALPHARDGEEGWRRFTAREVFVVAVCAEIRRKFGTPVERIKFVQDFMLEEGADHLAAAIKMNSSLGCAVWVMTDFEERFEMAPEMDFEDLWSHGFFGVDNESAFAFVNFTPSSTRSSAA